MSLALLIVLSVIGVVLETVAPVRRAGSVFLRGLEVVSVAVFTVEYLLRLWSCVADPRYASPVAGRLRYARSPLAIVDLLAIVPSLVPGGVLDLRFVRLLRLARLLRGLKLLRYSEALRLLARVVVSRREELAATATVGATLLFLSTCAMYFAENAAQPEAFSSIPASLWWGVVTLTTVGYGDVYPVTFAGRVLGAVVAVLGVGLFALPAGILAGAFAEELQKRRDGTRARCPHCGAEL